MKTAPIKAWCRQVFYFFLPLFIFNPNISLGSGISVTDVQIMAQDEVEDHYTIQYGLLWEYSWRTSSPNSWDAVWVFMKYRLNNSGEWRHATLSQNAADHQVASSLSLEVPSDGKGLFIYPSAQKSASASLSFSFQTSLQWNYGLDGVSDQDDVELMIFAIEMVYVPQGSFAIGDGNVDFNYFELTTINTSNAQVNPSGVGALGGQAGGHPTNANPPTTSNYPNGYEAFYCMKYEITQGQYLDFFNTLTAAQKVVRDISAASGKGSDALVNRNNFTWQGSGDASLLNDDYANTACNWLSPSDVLAYLDWAALRPMSEMEYEKACRGDQAPVRGEFAWGSPLHATSDYGLINSAKANEIISTNYSGVGGNALTKETSANVDGPLRVGIFTSHGSNTGRQTAGASYYGILDLTGNLEELTVGYSSPLFAAQLGDGTLDQNGNSDVSGWSADFMYRGGGFNTRARAVSERNYFSPRDLDNLLAWYDPADDSTVYSQGSLNTVDSLLDKSGQLYHLWNSTGFNQPSLVADPTHSELSYLSFDQDFLYTTTGLGQDAYASFLVLINEPNAITNQSSSQIFLSPVGDHISNGIGFGSVTGALNDEVITVLEGTAPGVYTDRQAASSQMLSSISPGVANLFYFNLKSNSNWYIGMNGGANLFDLSSGSRSPFKFANSFGIGAELRKGINNSARHFSGRMGELILLDVGLTSSDLKRKIEGYLGHKWEMTALLSSSHPYKTSPPLIDEADATDLNRRGPARGGRGVRQAP